MIGSFGQLLATRYGECLGDDALEMLEFVLGGARQMQALMNALGRYARIGSDPLRLVADRAVDELALATEAGSGSLLRGELPIVQADCRLLRELFAQLLTNAVIFRGKQAPRIRIDTVREGGTWIFSVRDNGQGIAASDLKRVFDLFAHLQRPEKGSGIGMGLAISTRIVEGHGGRIWLTSEPSVGTTVCFTLPAMGPADA